MYDLTTHCRTDTPVNRRSRSGVRTHLACLLACVLVQVLACGGDSAPTADVSEAEPSSLPPSPGATGAAAKTNEAPRIVFLGDSLTAGFGLDESQAFPALIGRRLAEQGIETRVINAGVSGDTSAGGLRRLDWILRQRPDILVVGLGGNDGLRGLSVDMTEENLRRILVESLAAGAQPILLGLKLPPNLGSDYVHRFEAIYPRLADELDVALVPFMLDGVAGVAELNFPDGIHPTAEGHRRVAETVLPWVEKALSETASPE